MPRRRLAVRTRLAVCAILGLAITTTGVVEHDSSAARSFHRLTITGRARGLYPGAVRPLKVIVRNPTNRDVRVLRIVARPSGAPSEDCPASLLRVRPLRSHPVVPARSRVRVRLRVKLLAAAPDACQGVRFPLRLHVRGVAA